MIDVQLNHEQANADGSYQTHRKDGCQGAHAFAQTRTKPPISVVPFSSSTRLATSTPGLTFKGETSSEAGEDLLHYHCVTYWFELISNEIVDRYKRMLYEWQKYLSPASLIADVATTWKSALKSAE